MKKCIRRCHQGRIGQGAEPHYICHSDSWLHQRHDRRKTYAIVAIFHFHLQSEFQSVYHYEFLFDFLVFQMILLSRHKLENQLEGLVLT